MLIREVALNLTEGALGCLNLISQGETQKDSPSPILMEDYFLLHYYINFVERLRQGKLA